MKQSTSYWDNRAINRYRRTDLKTKKATKRIKKLYNQAYHNINKDLESVYKNYSKSTGIDVQKLKEILSKSQTEKSLKQLKKQGLDKYIQNNYKARISRLEQIQAQIYGKAKLIYDKEELEQTMLYKGIVNDNYYKTIYDVQMGTGYNFSFSRLDKNLLNSVLTEKWSGKNYSERIWKNTDILAERVANIVGAGLISGQSLEKTSRQIRKEFDVAKYYADRLVRTESSYFHNQADMIAYKDMGVDKYVFVATLDNRTSEMCQNMDNKKFDYDKIEVGVNYPPLHPNCRSTTRGYLGEEAEKMLQRRARNPITGKNEIIDNISYSDWIKGINTLKNTPKSGIINISIDEMTPCLLRSKDNKFIDTFFKQLDKDTLLKQTEGWLFNWEKEENVLGLFTKDNPERPQGLISFLDKPKDNAIFVKLVENNPDNRKNRTYKGVGAHLFAEACKRSYELGYDGYIYFDSKTNLINYYRKTLNAKLISGQRMYIDEIGAKELIKKYYEKK